MSEIFDDRQQLTAKLSVKLSELNAISQALEKIEKEKFYQAFVNQAAEKNRLSKGNQFTSLELWGGIRSEYKNAIDDLLKKEMNITMTEIQQGKKVDQEKLESFLKSLRNFATDEELKKLTAARDEMQDKINKLKELTKKERKEYAERELFVELQREKINDLLDAKNTAIEAGDPVKVAHITVTIQQEEDKLKQLSQDLMVFKQALNELSSKREDEQRKLASSMEPFNKEVNRLTSIISLHHSIQFLFDNNLYNLLQSFYARTQYDASGKAIQQRYQASTEMIAAFQSNIQKKIDTKQSVSEFEQLTFNAITFIGALGNIEANKEKIKKLIKMLDDGVEPQHVAAAAKIQLDIAQGVIEQTYYAAHNCPDEQIKKMLLDTLPSYNYKEEVLTDLTNVVKPNIVRPKVKVEKPSHKVEDKPSHRVEDKERLEESALPQKTKGKVLRNLFETMKSKAQHLEKTLGVPIGETSTQSPKKSKPPKPKN